jgi:cation diffusion facilitator CzcD-associated flavoprotein CzcO
MGLGRLACAPLTVVSSLTAIGAVIPATKYNAYLHRYIDTFLGPNSIRYKTKLLHLERDPSHGWLLTVQANGTETQERYDKVALCTGADFTPMIPEALRGLGPDGPLVIHSGDGQPAYERVLKATEGSDKPVLVVGYGKSGVDACVWLVKQGRKVVLNIKKPVFYMGMDHKKPPPMKVVLSRLLTYLWPAREMKTRSVGVPCCRKSFMPRI